jgi:cytochrome c-type biogenesis protein
MNEQRTVKTINYITFITIGIALLALGGLGYLGFLAFVDGILMPGEFAAYGLVITTVAAATASFFSPCSFTVLPGYIAFASSGQDALPERRFRNALKNGIVAAMGVVTVVAVLGAVVGALGTGIGADLSITGTSPNPVVKALRISIGAFVLSMGLLHITGQSHRIPLLGKISAWAIRAEGQGDPSLRSIYAYGAGYVVVGIGCVGPFLAAVSAFALTTGGFLAAFLTFLLFAATMGGLMLVISLLVGTSRNLLLRRLRSSTAAIQRVASVFLILVGAGLIYFTLDLGTFQAIFFPS